VKRYPSSPSSSHCAHYQVPGELIECDITQSRLPFFWPCAWPELRVELERVKLPDS
jgi:hypothetical protein